MFEPRSEELMSQPRFAFVDTPAGAIVVAFVDRATIDDAVACRRLRRHIGRSVADLPVVLRCGDGAAVVLDGPWELEPFAAGAGVEALPTFAVEPQRAAA